MATALGWWKEEGERRLTGIEFQLCKTKKFWRSVSQQCEYTSHYRTLQLKMVKLQQALHSPRNLSLVSTVFEGKRPGAPLLPASDQPPASFPVTTFGTSSIILSLRHQPAPYCRAARSPQIHQRHSTQVEAPSTHQSACICRPPTSTCLWASVSTTTMWPGGRGPLLPRVGRGDTRGRPPSLKAAKPARRLRPLPGRAGAVSR